MISSSQYIIIYVILILTLLFVLISGLIIQSRMDNLNKRLSDIEIKLLKIEFFRTKTNG